MWGWKRYVPVAERREQGQKKMEKLKKSGMKVEPINLTTRTIAKTFWGKKWCDHLEECCDFDNRLPRGRTYVRNGSVCHLSISEGCIEAYVAGSSLYKVKITIPKLSQELWTEIKERCKGEIGSILELLTGKLSGHVMEVVADHKRGLFPQSKELKLTCSCPDWASMCKHVAATLYGVGSRLDERPELLFTLRGVDPSELIDTQIAVEATKTDDLLAGTGLEELFGIELETETASLPSDSTTEVPSKKSSKPPRNAKTKMKAKSLSQKYDVNNLSGKELEEIRHSLGLSVADFAERLSVTQVTIYRWEKTTTTLNLRQKSINAIQTLLKQL
ncbi:MAG: SWIM zinc finger family protein [Chlamydiia bacterium]|nr:SWIM zinc finger family protein [Chlamydiia bacterium]